MYKPMDNSGYLEGKAIPCGYPRGGYPSPGSPPLVGQPPQGAIPVGGYPPQGAIPMGSYPPQGAQAQGGYPPQGAIPMGGYPPKAASQHGDFSPQGAMPQGGYPVQGAYPRPQPGFQPGFVNEGYGMPTGGFVPPADLGEDCDVKGFDFTEKSIRRAFIRKVYAILSTQLLVSLAFISLFTFHEPTKMWVRSQGSMFLIIAMVVTLVCVLAMACCEDVRRTSPMNFIFLAIFTIAESFLLGAVSSMYQADIVMMAVGITAVICFSLTLFAMQTKFDFTVMGAGLFIALVILTLFGFIALFIPKNTILTLVYSSAGALLFSLYLIYDTQLMMGGNHKYTVSPEEYVFAALNLYLDIINIFLYILRIIAAAKS